MDRIAHAHKGERIMLTLDKFEEAAEKIREVTLPTPLQYSEYFSRQTGNKVYLKPENMQLTGAYKVRGAYYKISTLSEEEKKKGLITASAGNHAQGVAYAARRCGAKAVVVMPTTTPLIKVERTKNLGAEVVLYGDVYDQACEHALELAKEHGYTFIHPFNDLTVATGQGSIMMEIIKDLPTVDYVLVPVGGGGLATGVSTLAKLLNPHIRVIGVEPSGAACLTASLKAGKVVTLPSASTIADGTAVLTPGDQLFPYLQKNLDQVLTIDDDELIAAFLDMVENHKMVVENSGLLPVAALKHLDVKSKKVVCILSGGRQHGCHHDGFRRSERSDHERPDLHGLRPASRQAGISGPRRPGDRKSEGQCDQAGAQPVLHHEPQRGCRAPCYDRGLWHCPQAGDSFGSGKERIPSPSRIGESLILSGFCLREFVTKRKRAIRGPA